MLRNLHIQYFKGLTDVKLSDCGPINALVGKNNSGKSSVLHAIDMAGLAISTGSWNQFQPKLAIKDMFSRAGSFMIALDYSDGLTMTVGSNAQNESPSFEPNVSEGHRFRSLLIMPDPEMGMLRRRHVTPASVMTAVENRQYGNINGLDILYAFRYYSQRRQRGLQPETYEQLIADIREFFPDIEDLEADRTDEDVATLTYQEYGRKLDILYSGTGLKQFLDTVVKITLSQASIVLIDEPEAGLHPDLQRKFIDFMKQLAEQKDLQFYIASHSPVFLSHRDVTVYRITNKKGHRDVVRTENDALHTVWADMGIRPSDLLQNDIVVMVEGQKDVIIFDHIINSLYQRELDGVSVGIIQYGGSSADGIIAGHFNVENITSAQGYVLWIRDRDAKPGDPPPTNASKFANAIHKANQKCHILGQREIEWYLPESLYVEAQQGNSDCEATIKAVLAGNQEEKFRNAAKGCTVPQGKTLRLSMQKHVSRGDLNDELKRLVEDTLIPWRNKIVG